MAKQVDYKAVGLRIKTLRLKNNIYQTELAKSIGVSQTHMSNIESGRTGLTLENLVKMTNIFNCGIDDIVFGEEKAKKEKAEKKEDTKDSKKKTEEVEALKLHLGSMKLGNSVDIRLEATELPKIEPYAVVELEEPVYAPYVQR